MPDTDRYHRWAAMLAASDNTLVQLALLAAAAVFVWEVLRSVPEPWRGRGRLLYVAIALGFMLMQILTMPSSLILMLAVVTFILARGLSQSWHRAHSAPRLLRKDSHDN